MDLPAVCTDRHWANSLPSFVCSFTQLLLPWLPDNLALHGFWLLFLSSVERQGDWPLGPSPLDLWVSASMLKTSIPPQVSLGKCCLWKVKKSCWLLLLRPDVFLNTRSLFLLLFTNLYIMVCLFSRTPNSAHNSQQLIGPAGVPCVLPGHPADTWRGGCYLVGLRSLLATVTLPPSRHHVCSKARI